MVTNQSQCDSDGDRYGNHCDGDMNNNGATAVGTGALTSGLVSGR